MKKNIRVSEPSAEMQEKIKKARYAIANQNKVCGNEESCLDAAICCPYSAIDIHEI